MSCEVKETTHDVETANANGAGQQGDATRRRLFVMRTGAWLFAVYADEVEATCENLLPTPLPFAPPPVRGVVSRRGRIFTLIDPLPLLPAAPPADDIEHEIELYDDETDAPLEGDDTRAKHAATTATDANGNPLPLRRIIPYRREPVALLDPARLFDASMRGVERRRQRT